MVSGEKTNLINLACDSQGNGYRGRTATRPWLSANHRLYAISLFFSLVFETFRKCSFQRSNLGLQGDDRVLALDQGKRTRRLVVMFGGAHPAKFVTLCDHLLLKH
jgi:hypothetical protein